MKKKAAGEVHITGLDENSGYYITLRNDARMFTYTNMSGEVVTLILMLNTIRCLSVPRVIPVSL